MIRRLFWLLFALSLAALAASSLALFAGPSPDVALWSGWSFLGLSRPRWEALHMGMGLLLALSGAVCLVVGSRRMMGATDAEEGADPAPAWITALLVFAVLALASVLMLPPGGTLVAMSGQLKSWHAKSFGAPPRAGAADLSPTELAKRLGLDPGRALANLAAHNVKLASPDATLAEIARQNGLVPAAVYETLRAGKEPKAPQEAPVQAQQQPKAPPPPPALPSDPPPGLGRLKLTDVCEQYGLDLKAAVDKLSKAGIRSSGDMTLRQIAQSNLMLPIEVYDALRGVPAPQPQAAPAPAPAQAPAQIPAQAPVQAPAQTPAAQLPPSQAPQAQDVPAQAPALAPGQLQTPAQVPGQIPGQTSAPQHLTPPEGLDRMTLAAFCRDNGIDTAQALARLKAKGIVAFSDMTFRELGIENNLTPEQVMEMAIR